MRSFDKSLQCKVLCKDIAYTDNKNTYRRMIIDNILDERYYKANEIEADVPKMLDPHNMIVFFKSEI